MNMTLRGLGASAALSVFGASAVGAQVTAEDVWGAWQQYLIDSGYEVTGAAQQTGSGLAVQNFVATMTDEIGGDTSTFKIAMPELTFSELGDGRVQIGFPEVTDMTLSGSDSADDYEAKVDFTQIDVRMIVSGSPEEMVYDYTASEMDMRLVDLMVDDEPVGSDVARVAITLSDLSGQTTAKPGDLSTYAQTVTAGTLVTDVFFNNPEAENERFQLASTLSGLSVNATTALPSMEAGVEDVNALLDDGFAFDASMQFGAGEMETAFQDSDGGGTFNSTSAGGTLSAAMSQSGLEYALSQQEQAVNMLLSDVPFPLSLELGETKASLQMPVQKSDDPQDFSFGLTLRDFVMSEMIWGLIDPGQEFARDAATLDVGLTGKAKLLFDILDPTTAAVLDQSGAIPGEVQEVSLNTLLLDAIGARLSASGAFTFDNTDMATFDGFPKPTGSMKVDLVGANMLLDKLTKIGLLSAEDAQGALFFTGLFARPGPEPDSLTSTLEVTEDGQVLANGQRIR